MTGIAVIVVAHDSGPLLAQCVTRVLADAACCEVLVVDNASQDGAVDAVAAMKNARVLIVEDDERWLKTFHKMLGGEVALLDGSLNPQARQALVDRFQAGEIDVLVLSLRAAGAGINLTAATQVIHYDRWWNPAVEDQASDRAHRIGQTTTVVVHRLIANGTLERRIADVLEGKRKLAKALTAGGEGWICDLTDDELADLVLLSPLARQDAAA